MFTTRALLCFALVFAVTGTAVNRHGSKIRTHKILDIIHRLLKVAAHGGYHHHDRFVAFDVALTRNFAGQRSGHKVLYNKINLNIGGAYNQGEFTCPLDGVYEFIWTSLSSPSHKAETYIFVNGKLKRKNFNQERTGKTYLLSTTSLISDLKKGDRVWIGTERGQVLFGNSNEHSSFQGKLLHAN